MDPDEFQTLVKCVIGLGAVILLITIFYDFPGDDRPKDFRPKDFEDRDDK